VSDADRPDPAAIGDVDLIVQVSPGHKVESVAERLRAAGVQVEREWSRARLVGCKAPRALIGEVERIPGVAMVRESEPVRLPPFSDKIPQ
jgi:hypothetical protein